MKQKIIFVFSFLIFLLSVVQIVYNIVNTLTSRNLIDFSVYYQAINTWAQGKNPYQHFFGQSPDKIPFNYPPSALIVLLPFKLLPIKIAEIALIVLSLLSLWLTLWIILKLTNVKISTAHFLLILAFFNQTFPVKFTLILGQINLIVLGLSYGGLYLYFCKNPKSEILNPKQILNFNVQNSKQKRNLKSLGFRYLNLFGASNLGFRILSILLLSLASSLKIFPLFTLPLFFIFGDFKFVFSVLGIFLALNILPSVDLFEQYYFQIIPNLLRAVEVPNFYDQSLLAFLLRLNLPIFWAKILTLVILFALFGWILAKFYRHLNPPPRSPFGHLGGVSLIFALFSIGNLFSWQHHLVFTYPLIFILYLTLLGRSRPTPTKLFLFFFIWLIFVFHFKTEASPLLNNPLIASYQTIVIFFVIFASLSMLKLFIYPKKHEPRTQNSPRNNSRSVCCG
jgi:hypothetical protein